MPWMRDGSKALGAVVSVMSVIILAIRVQVTPVSVKEVFDLLAQMTDLVSLVTVGVQIVLVINVGDPQ